MGCPPLRVRGLHVREAGRRPGGGSPGFAIAARVELREVGGGMVETLGPHRAEIASTAGGGALVPVDPARIPWDRNGGTFEGTVDLTTKAQLQNGRGKDVGGMRVASDPGVGITKGG